VTKRSSILIAALAAGLGALVWVRAQRSGGPALEFETAPVQRGSLAARVTATGTLSPLVTVQVGSQVTGRIQELRADFNSKVTKDQVIAVIDPRLFESELVEARANLESARAGVARARAELENARLQHERTASLAARELAPRADADAARAAHQSAEAQVAAAEAALAQAAAAVEQAETQLAYTTIRSPIDGVVISRDVELGQTVAASLQAPTLFTIAEDLRKMELHTNVSEADVGRLAPGMPAEFGVDAYPTDRFRGAVREIRYAPQTVQNVVTYDAVVAVDNGELKLRPGMTADVSFQVDERSDVLLVPNAALRFQPPPEALDGEADALRAEAPAAGARNAPSRERVVWTPGGGGRLRPLRVQIGVSDGQSTEVTGADLAEGVEVVTGIVGVEPAKPGSQGNPRFGRFL
jgi:HlyD family secretion protein